MTAMIELTKANFDEVTAGKHTFVTLTRPNCPPCEKIKPDLEKVAEHYKDDDKKIIGNINCAADEEAMKWCATFADFEGTPGFYTGMGGSGTADMTAHDVTKTFEGMKELIEYNLRPKCTVADQTSCTEGEVAKIDEFLAMSKELLDKKKEELLLVAESEKMPAQWKFRLFDNLRKSLAQKEEPETPPPKPEEPKPKPEEPKPKPDEPKPKPDVPEEEPKPKPDEPKPKPDGSEEEPKDSKFKETIQEVTSLLSLANSKIKKAIEHLKDLA